jgi:predicted SAM-dependent methyltransferase
VADARSGPKMEHAMPITRLQLGTSRLEGMGPAALSVFLDDSWLHLGESKPVEATPLERFQNHVELYGLLSAGLHLPRVALRRARRRAPVPPTPDVSGTSFEPFHFGLDSPLSASDQSFDFVFAEHFIEHLFLDEALFLVDEVFRLLRPGGVFRVVCPDADLRRNCPPERVGHPSEKMRWDHPDKHKSRWSVRSLPEVLRRAGFQPHALRYYSVTGELHVFAGNAAGWFSQATERELVSRTDYLRRPESLIVDGFKP